MSNSKNSQVAKNGNLTQKCLEVKCIKIAVYEHILSIKDKIARKTCDHIEYPSGKKTDIIVHPYNLKLQVKRVSSFEADRGHHVDRRKLSDFCSHFQNNSQVQRLMQRLMITRDITSEEKEELTELLNDKVAIFNILLEVLLGKIKYFMPDHILFIETVKDEYAVYICNAHTVIGYILKNMNISVKETCVHLGKNMYFQRRGGDKTDKSPNDIQTKLKLTPEIKNISTLICVCKQELFDNCINNIGHNTISKIE